MFGSVNILSSTSPCETLFHFACFNYLPVVDNSRSSLPCIEVLS